jgi:2-polyprenyl-3-methyl-5-hydroxy-6-metoxy-1,4-benzoquinol methylase
METSEIGGQSSHYDLAVRRSGFSETHRAILARVPSGSTVLELGPASGYMTEVLAGKACTVDAIELNPTDAAKAARHCRKLVTGSVEDGATWSELSGPYDVVIAADVLEHLRDPEGALAEIARRLRPGGDLLVSLPNVAYWKMRVDLLLGRFEYTDTGLLDRTHLRFFTLRTAEELFSRSGFRVAEVVVPPAKRPLLRPFKTWLKETWPTLFALQVVFRLRTDRDGRG